MNRSCDILIIGAGILGCFAARSLSRYDLDTVVLEQREDVCCGISRANTGIIYQGYDQHPGSLKAQMCRKANAAFPSLCEELDVSYRKTGLLMLSFGPRADAVLCRKLSQGQESQIPGISLLGRDQVYQMEPLLCSGVTSALYSESTYTVDPWELGIAAFENASSNHVEFRFQEKVMNIYPLKSRTSPAKDRFVVETSHHTYTASFLLCCAGSSSDRLWEMVSAPSVRIVPVAGDYLVFDKSVGNLISHVLSVEPENKGGGITLVPTAGGNILAGPTRRTPSPESHTAADINGLHELREKCQRLVPSLPPDKVIRSFAAVRPDPYIAKADGSLSAQSLNDFMILEDHGFFALIGIKTPGITCAKELGDYLARRVIASMEQEPGPNPSYTPIRKGIMRFASLLRDTSDADAGMPHIHSCETKALPSEFFEIICRCEHVSKWEVLEAIRRGAVTIDGVKRRTGAGMGRCQGGYCMEKVLHLLSEYTNTDIYQITKDGRRGTVLNKAFPCEEDSRKL